ncbi:MAG: hypothetical protein FWE00_01975 [Defluviitaleaceae bacterium]|nr:hypothetical protein [Defluviitaleaceae bacterium]
MKITVLRRSRCGGLADNLLMVGLDENPALRDIEWAFYLCQFQVVPRKITLSP